MSAHGGAPPGGMGPDPAAGPASSIPPSGSSQAPPEPEETAPPDLREALRQVTAAGRSGVGASVEAAKALRTLVSADLALARSAAGRAMAFAGLAVAFGASAWLLLMGALVSFLNRQAGWGWTPAVLTTAALSLLGALFGGWQAMRYYEHTRLKATRRQLARLGLGELAEFTPTPGSPVSARDFTEKAPPKTPDGKPVKDARGVDVTPP